jgi:hypothetical protein
MAKYVREINTSGSTGSKENIRLHRIANSLGIHTIGIVDLITGKCDLVPNFHKNIDVDFDMFTNTQFSTIPTKTSMQITKKFLSLDSTTQKKLKERYPLKTFKKERTHLKDFKGKILYCVGWVKQYGWDKGLPFDPEADPDNFLLTHIFEWETGKKILDHAWIQLHPTFMPEPPPKNKYITFNCKTIGYEKCVDGKPIWSLGIGYFKNWAIVDFKDMKTWKQGILELKKQSTG